MQVKETVRDYINRAVAHHKLKGALEKARKTLEKLGALESLQKENKLSDANDLVLRLYNELFDFEDILESLGIKGICESTQSKLKDCATALAKVHKLRTDHVGYISKDYSSNKLHMTTKKSFEEILVLFENNLDELKTIQDEAIHALQSSFRDPSLLLNEKLLSKTYIVPPVEEGHEFKFLTERFTQKTAANQHKFDFSPLQYAAHLGCIPAVEVFCNRLSKVEPKTLRLTGEFGVSALSRAAKCEDRVIPLLVNSFPSEITNLIIDAMQSDDYVSVKTILNSAMVDAELNVPELLSKMLSTPHGCFDPGKMLALAAVVSKDADLAKNRETITDQITQIREYGDGHDGLNILMIIELLKWSARSGKLTQINNTEQNLLHLFCQKGHDLPVVIETFSKLTQRQQNLADMEDNLGNLPLHYATQNNMTKSVGALLLNTSNINKQNKDGKTALHLAAEIGNPDIINMLYFKGADPFVKDKEGKTPSDIIKEKKVAFTKNNHDEKDRIKADLDLIKTNNGNGDKDKAKGLLNALKEALLEYNKLISDERTEHEKTKVGELTAKINLLKKSIRQVLSQQQNDALKLADLVGLSNLQTNRLGVQNHLDKKLTDLENAAKLLANYTRSFDEKENVPSAPATKREIKYTVFKGGGPKGTANVGALIKAIKDNFVIPEEQIGTAGTSAGAIVGLLWALRNTGEQLGEKLFNLEFMSFLDDVDRTHTETVMGYGDSIKTMLNGTASFLGKLSTLRSLPSLFEELGKHRSGLFKGEVYKDWLIDQILEKVRGTEVLERINVELTQEQKKEYDALDTEIKKQEYILRKKVALITFQDFKDFPDLFLEFKCFGTNIATQRGEEYSVEKTPNATILSAMRITMSLPVIFQPAFLEERRLVREEEGKRYYQSVRVDDNPRIDGGLFDNYPASAFDVDPKTGVELYNPHTLGFCLVPPHQFQEFACDGPTQHAPVDDKSFLDYLFKMVFAVMWGQQDYYHGRGLDHERTVYVSTLDVGTLDFNITDRKKEDLCDSGGAVGILDYQGAHGHTLEPTSLSIRTRKRLVKNGLFKEFTHHQHVHSRFEPGRLVSPVEILKLYAKADEKDLPTLSKLVNTNTRDANGITALHLAKALGFKETYDRLVKYQANENAVSKNGVIASRTAWDDIKPFVNTKAQDQVPVRLPGYLFDESGQPKYLEKDFVNSKKSKLRHEVHEKELALGDLEKRRREENERLLAGKASELQQLQAQNQTALHELTEREAQARLNLERDKNSDIEAKNRELVQLREQLEGEKNSEIERKNRELQELRERLEREKNVLIEQNGLELTALRERLAEVERERDNKHAQLDPKKMTISLFKRYIERKVISRLRAAADNEQEQAMKISLNQLTGEIDAALNGHANLDGKARIDAIKEDLVELLNDIIEGEDQRFTSLTDQVWYMTLLKGFVGIIAGFVGFTIPFFFEGYRNTFFNGGYANQLSYIREDVDYFERQVVPVVAA
ncbi:MAG: ankyrin repeat domain-containing protein [Gammaproteobacteria bacterium]|nr:ankyrin repeat domain-containing protein [Gammaproteobacteria bacterium]